MFAVVTASVSAVSTYCLVAIPKFALGSAFTLAVAVAPSIVITVVGVPPSLTPIVMSPSDVLFLITTSSVLIVTVKSELAPTVIPPSFKTPSVPAVVSFVVLLKKSVSSYPLRLVASPWNLTLPIELIIEYPV